VSILKNKKIAFARGPVVRGPHVENRWSTPSLKAI